MATTYNIEIREFNGIDYDILYPKTTMENIDGLANSFSQINDEIEGLSQDIDNLQRTKQDTATLKALAFKDKATLTNGENVFGILPVNYGGTGLISSPSMLVNLGSANADNILKESPRPGVTGMLPVDNGGTGLSASPSMLVNLGSANADNVLKESPRPGVTGMLSVDNGGTGLNASPSMLVNLGSDTPANVMQSNPQPGVTGKLGIANGGTNGTTASEARSNLGITDIATHPDYTISNTDLTDGSSPLATGKLYFYYE